MELALTEVFSRTIDWRGGKIFASTYLTADQLKQASHMLIWHLEGPAMQFSTQLRDKSLSPPKEFEQGDKLEVIGADVAYLHLSGNAKVAISVSGPGSRVDGTGERN